MADEEKSLIKNINKIVPHIEEFLNLSNVSQTINTTAQTITQAKDDVVNIKSQIDNINTDVTKKSNEIKNLNTEIVILAEGSNASVNYNASTGLLTLRIPRVKGVKGDKGESFKVDKQDLLSQRHLYDDALAGFSFLALNNSTLYFKKSDESADWSDGVSFGKGDKGDSVTITQITNNGNYTFTWVFSDGNTFTTPSLRGEKGDEPAHEVGDNKIRFKKPDDTWGDWISLAPNGFLENSTTLGDIVVPTNTNKAVLSPCTFSSFKVEDGASLKIL